MHRFAFLRLLALLAALPCAASAAPFSNAYFFGDSLTDSGNDFLLSSAIHATDPGFPIVPDPAGYNASGRFSNGPVYSEMLAARLGVDLRPSLAGGTNYAYGGARTASVALPFSLDFVAQVQQYIDVPGAADPDALYVLFIGANDVRDVLGGRLGPEAIGAAVARIGGAIDALADEGVRHFLVPGVPDLGLAPAATGNGAIPRNEAATAASAAFNAALAAMLAGFDALDIVAFDTFALLDGIVADPARFGLTDATHACQRELGTLPDGRPAYEISCTDAEAATRMFWDDIHPTTAGHRILADAMFAVLPVAEPATLALLLAAWAGAAGARGRRGVATA